MDGRAARKRSIVGEGLTVGLIGAAAVALWFLIWDALQGRLLFTPSALGSAFFLGADDPAGVAYDPLIILGYTALHVAIFVALGMLLAWAARAAERFPPALIGAAVLFVTLEVFVIGLIAIVATWLLDAISWWNFAIANLIAVAFMGMYLWRRHPLIQDELQRPDLEAERM